MSAKKLKNKIDKVHYFNIIKIANDCIGNSNILLECNCKICMTFYFHNIVFENDKNYEYMKDFKNVLKYFIKNSKYIIRCIKVPLKKNRK